MSTPPTPSPHTPDPEDRPAPRGRVLLVDDEAMVVRVVARLLERSGFLVRVHTDPRRALEEIRHDPQRFDVLLTDMTMPGMTGIELARGAAAAGATMPVILLSGWIDAESERAARSAGIARILSKPIQVTSLVDVVTEVVSDTRH